VLISAANQWGNHDDLNARRGRAGGLLAAPAFADDITEAMEQARKAYQSGDLTNAKQSPISPRN
jgi:hypothetical protein